MSSFTASAVLLLSVTISIKTGETPSALISILSLDFMKGILMLYFMGITPLSTSETRLFRIVTKHHLKKHSITLDERGFFGLQSEFGRSYNKGGLRIGLNGINHLVSHMTIVNLYIRVCFILNLDRRHTIFLWIN